MGWLASQTYVTAAASNVGVATGRFSAAANAGTLLGPLLVGFLVEFASIDAGFVAVGLFSLFFTIVGLVLPDVGNGHEDTGAQEPGYKSLLREESVQAVLLYSYARLWVYVAWVASG